MNHVHLCPNGREMVHAVAFSEAVRSSVVALQGVVEARLCKPTSFTHCRKIVKK